MLLWLLADHKGKGAGPLNLSGDSRLVTLSPRQRSSHSREVCCEPAATNEAFWLGRGPRHSPQQLTEFPMSLRVNMQACFCPVHRDLISLETTLLPLVTTKGTGASSLIAVQRDSEYLSGLQDDTLILKALSLLWLVVSGPVQSVRDILIYSLSLPVACTLIPGGMLLSQ